MMGVSSQDNYLAIIREIIEKGLRGYQARVYFFGSRVTGSNGRASDVDVGIEPLEVLPAGLLSKIREQLEQSNVPFEVDLVDLTEAPEPLVNNVRKEGILWRD